MYVFIIIHNVVIDSNDVHERQSSPLLKAAYRVLNIVCHGLINNSSFRYVFRYVSFHCPVCKEPNFYSRRLLSTANFINNIYIYNQYATNINFVWISINDLTTNRILLLFVCYPVSSFHSFVIIKYI